MTPEASLTIIAICQLLGAIAFVALVIAIIVVIKKAKTALDSKTKEIMDKVDPIIQDAKRISAQTKETVDTVAARVDSVAGKVEETARNISDRVDSVAERVDCAVTPQMTKAVGAAATVAKAVEVIIRSDGVAKAARHAASTEETVK